MGNIEAKCRKPKQTWQYSRVTAFFQQSWILSKGDILSSTLSRKTVYLTAQHSSTDKYFLAVSNTVIVICSPKCSFERGKNQGPTFGNNQDQSIKRVC